MHVSDLQVWNLQYLLLAEDLNIEEHKLIIGLYNQRNNISKQLTLELDKDESQFNEIWETSTNYIINIYRSMKDTSVETVLCKMFEYVKRSSHMMCYAEKVWCNLEAEFGNKDPYPFDLTTEEREMRENQVYYTSIQLIIIFTDEELVIAKLESHDNGIIANTITTEKERDSQCIRLEIDKDGVLTSDDQLESIKRLENTTLNPNDEPIKILKVYKGSIVIEAKVKFCTTDVTLLMKAVREILHHVIEICQIPKQKDFVLKVGIKVGQPYKGKFV
ncbi:unnamed protein product [Mytilus edulis]|uniref:Uncharacterized protein n=1 Tax=Mytilus edulis TaxID=6550 RepID=A0A8S3QHC5_MYTED|nr:unnamed protein product [Mytilus edulis]